MTSQHGLSNILVRFATGQGYRTRDFLSRHLNKWFTSVEDVTAVFEAAEWTNQTANSHNRILYSDGRCWGQYSRQLDLKPSLERSIQARLQALFSSEVQTAWQEYWKDSYGLDYRSIPESSLPTYQEVFDLLDKLNIEGFGSGSITQMQLANYFAIEGLCQQPTPDAMGYITAQNKKGTLKGLLILGFDVRNAKQEDIVLAFNCVYRFLDAHLSLTDKQILGFNAIFVEHLLCKVIRWYNMLNKANLLVEVERLLAKAKANPEDHNNFPLPLNVDRPKLYDLVNAL